MAICKIMFCDISKVQDATKINYLKLKMNNGVGLKITRRWFTYAEKEWYSRCKRKTQYCDKILVGERNFVKENDWEDKCVNRWKGYLLLQDTRNHIHIIKTYLWQWMAALPLQGAAGYEEKKHSQFRSSFPFIGMEWKVLKALLG